MNLTNEQIDAACEALQAMKQKKVLWIVRDRDNDAADRPTSDEAEARCLFADRNQNGHFGPYTLYRCEQVA